MAPMDLNETRCIDCASWRKAYAACDCEGWQGWISLFAPLMAICWSTRSMTFPGMTPTSLYARLLEVTDGTTYPQMLERLMDLAIDSYKEKQLSIDVKR